MSDYVISCSSTADLSAEHFEEIDVSYICFHLELDGVEYQDDLGKSISFADFYARMANGADTKTSQINVEEFTQYFDAILAQGKDLIHVSLSSGISGVSNSAMLAAEQLREKYPDRRIYIVDSLAASSGYGLIMDKMAELRDGGMSLEDLYTWVEEHKLEMNHWFFSTDLTFYIKGGRVSPLSGTVGNILGVCPLLNVDNLGRLIPREKIRGKKKVAKRMVECMEQHAQGRLGYADKCYISMSACMEDAQYVAAMIEERFPSLKGKVLINNIGTTIGAHTGPGTVALFFWGDKRVN